VGGVWTRLRHSHECAGLANRRTRPLLQNPRLHDTTGDLLGHRLTALRVTTWQHLPSGGSAEPYLQSHKAHQICVHHRFLRLYYYYYNRNNNNNNNNNYYYYSHRVTGYLSMCQSKTPYWDVAPYCLANWQTFRNFSHKGDELLHHDDGCSKQLWNVGKLLRNYMRILALKMVAISTSESSVNFSESTRLNIPESSYCISIQAAVRTWAPKERGTPFFTASNTALLL
jgi:hypothetical protein